MGIDTGGPRHQNVHIVIEPGGVLDAVQVGRRRPGDQRLRRQPQSRSAAGQFVVTFEAGIGVHIMSESDPGRAAQLVSGDHALSDRGGSTEDPPGEGWRSVGVRRHFASL
ncbi:hypothetical protein [Micromonospora lupini]|uniref:hypothetical protein n=1 Tax=Micromonospora lupini TaxID=285679 RepID=UPI0033EF29D8